MTKKTILIATPMYGGMCSGQYAKSLMEAVPQLAAAGYSVIYSDIANESLITRARNALTHGFLSTNADYLLFIDADQSFRAVDVIRMVESGRDLIGAPVPMKSINWQAIRDAAIEGKVDISEYSGIFNFNLLDQTLEVDDLKAPVEVKYIGCGMMLISRSALESVAKLVPSYKNNSTSLGGISYGEPIKDFWRTDIDDDETLLSEDYNFCKMWRSLGGKVYLDLQAKVSHVGTYIFNGKVIDEI